MTDKAIKKLAHIPKLPKYSGLCEGVCSPRVSYHVLHTTYTPCGHTHTKGEAAKATTQTHRWLRTISHSQHIRRGRSYRRSCPTVTWLSYIHTHIHPHTDTALKSFESSSILIRTRMHELIVLDTRINWVLL